jgi:hypothetical protein
MFGNAPIGLDPYRLSDSADTPRYRRVRPRAARFGGSISGGLR